MKRRSLMLLLAVAVSAAMTLTPIAANAQQSQEPGGFSVLGSVLLSILHVPLKLVTCVGTQVIGGVAYAGTYGVAGHYDGGTNGRDIGETARRSCTGDWIITPRQVQDDYGE